MNDHGKVCELAWCVEEENEIVRVLNLGVVDISQKAGMSAMGSRILK